MTKEEFKQKAMEMFEENIEKMADALGDERGEFLDACANGDFLKGDFETDFVPPKSTPKALKKLYKNAEKVLGDSGVVGGAVFLLTDSDAPIILYRDERELPLTMRAISYGIAELVLHDLKDIDTTFKTLRKSVEKCMETVNNER